MIALTRPRRLTVTVSVPEKRSIGDAHASDLRMRNPFLWPSPLSRSAAGLGCELRLTSGSQSVGLFGCLTNGSAFVEPAASDADDGQLGQRAGEEAAARAFVEQVL